jgi:hypothetical protein
VSEKPGKPGSRIKLENGTATIELRENGEYYCMSDEDVKRTQVYTELMKKLRELNPCPACASAAALYAAAVGAVYGMGDVNREEFLETAGRIFDDVVLQKLGRQGAMS